MYPKDHVKITYNQLTKYDKNRIAFFLESSNEEEWERIAYYICQTKDSSLDSQSPLLKFTAKQFEHFCAYVLMQTDGREILYLDIDNEYNADGGVDIVAKKGNTLLFVQCKKHNAQHLYKMKSKTKTYNLVTKKHIETFVRRMNEPPVSEVFRSVQNLQSIKKEYLYITLGFFDRDVKEAYPDNSIVRRWQLYSLQKIEYVQQLAAKYQEKLDEEKLKFNKSRAVKTKIQSANAKDFVAIKTDNFLLEDSFFAAQTKLNNHTKKANINEEKKSGKPQSFEESENSEESLLVWILFLQFIKKFAISTLITIILLSFIQLIFSPAVLAINILLFVLNIGIILYSFFVMPKYSWVYILVFIVVSILLGQTIFLMMLFLF